jgi:hypothetical protein
LNESNSVGLIKAKQHKPHNTQSERRVKVLGIKQMLYDPLLDPFFQVNFVHKKSTESISENGFHLTKADEQHQLRNTKKIIADFKILSKVFERGDYSEIKVQHDDLRNKIVIFFEIFTLFIGSIIQKDKNICQKYHPRSIALSIVLYSRSFIFNKENLFSDKIEHYSIHIDKSGIKDCFSQIRRVFLPRLKGKGITGISDRHVHKKGGASGDPNLATEDTMTGGKKFSERKTGNFGIERLSGETASKIWKSTNGLTEDNRFEEVKSKEKEFMLATKNSHKGLRMTSQTKDQENLLTNRPGSLKKSHKHQFE